MENEQICELANNICNILENHTNNEFVDYIINCISSNSYACIENFKEYQERY